MNPPPRKSQIVEANLIILSHRFIREESKVLLKVHLNDTPFQRSATTSFFHWPTHKEPPILNGKTRRPQPIVFPELNLSAISNNIVIVIIVLWLLDHIGWILNLKAIGLGIGHCRLYHCSWFQRMQATRVVRSPRNPASNAAAFHHLPNTHARLAPPRTMRMRKGRHDRGSAAAGKLRGR
jgi:hypothetical protein